jgi:hypothetical protein
MIMPHQDDRCTRYDERNSEREIEIESLDGGDNRDLDSAQQLLVSADDWYERNGFDSFRTDNAHARLCTALLILADHAENTTNTTT